MKNIFISIFVLLFLPLSAQRTILTVQAGEALGNETWVYIKVADGKAWKADLAAAASQAIGFVAVGGAVNDEVQVFLSGEVNITTGLTIGSYYFLSAVTPGTYTATQGAGDYQQLFKAIAADQIFIDIKATVSASGGGLAIGDAVTSATAGSVLFTGAAGVLAQKNASLFWNNTSNRLGIGTNNPLVALDARGTIYANRIANYVTPSISWNNATTYGFDSDGANLLMLGGGDLSLVLTPSLKNFRVPANYTYSWASSNANTSAPDAGFSRVSANKVAIGNGSAANGSGTLVVGNVGIGTSSPTKNLTIGNSGTFGIDATNTPTATTGAQTINKSAGTVNFAAGATTLTVTNSLVSTASLIFPVIRTNDATATIKNVVAAAGSFTITLNAAATAETSVGFFLIN